MKLKKTEKDLLRRALIEDVGSGDKTARLLVDRHTRGSCVVVAKEKGVFCGEAVARELIRLTHQSLKFKCLIHDGDRFQAKKKILILSGSVTDILSVERTLLNFIAHLSGVATQTFQLSQAAGKKIKIYDTRKTTPIWRSLEKYAVRCGGGFNHRMGLYDEVFVKENHRLYGDLKKLRRIPRKFVIEVRDMREVIEAITYKPRVILLDNFSPAKIKRAVMFIRRYDSKIRIEASGGIHARNISTYAKTGIDQISAGSLTHSVKAIDFSLLMA